MSKLIDFEPIDIGVTIKAVKIETGKKTDSLFIPGQEDKVKDAEGYQFFVEKIGSEVGKGREPYFNRVDLKIGDEVSLRHTTQLMARKGDEFTYIVTTHDILGVKRGETEA